MYISFRSHEDAKKQAQSDVNHIRPLVIEAFKSGSREVILNNNAGPFLDNESEHPYVSYLDTISAYFDSCYWKVEERDGYAIVSLVWDECSELQAA